MSRKRSKKKRVNRGSKKRRAGVPKEHQQKTTAKRDGAGRLAFPTSLSHGSLLSIEYRVWGSRCDAVPIGTPEEDGGDRGKEGMEREENVPGALVTPGPKDRDTETERKLDPSDSRMRGRRRKRRGEEGSRWCRDR